MFDELVEFITKIVEPLDVPWLHSGKEGDTPTATNHGTGPAEDDNSDEELLPGIQDIHEKKRRMEEDSMVVETDTVNLQCAGDSADNLPDTNNSTASLADTSDSAVKIAGINNSAANIPGMRDDDVTQVQANDNSTVNSQVGVNTIEPKPSGKRKRKRRARRSSKTNQNNVGSAYLRPCVKSFDVGKDKGNQGK